MMIKRLSVITLSAVLGGLVLGLPTPAAHGHGNNPQPDRSDTGPSTGPNPNPPFLPWMMDPVRDIGDGLPIGIGDSPGESFGGSGGGPAGGGLGLRLLILGDMPPVDPGTDATFGSGSLGVQPDGSFGGTGSFTAMPSGGAIPTPGTLGLLGVAALMVRRRRRR
jgi:MYXO-CTERM domain-containing protein